MIPEAFLQNKVNLSRSNAGSHRNRRGQILIESIISITVLVVGLLGIFSVISQSLGLYRVGYEQYVAANLAGEGIEVVKNMIDSNIIDGTVAWNKNLANNGNFSVDYQSRLLSSNFNSNLLYDSATGLYSYTSTPTSSPSIFKRRIHITNIASGSGSVNEIRVNSVVTWKTRGGKDSTIDLEDRFFNWR